MIDTELALADLESVEKALDRAARAAKTGDKKVLARKELLDRVRDQLDQARPVRALGLDADERAEIRDLFLLTAKPTMYIANVDEDGFARQPDLDAVRAHAETEGAAVVPVCAAIEAEIVELEDDGAGRVPAGPGARRAGPQPRGARRLPAAGAGDLFHRRTQGGARLDHPGRRHAPPRPPG